MGFVQDGQPFVIPTYHARLGDELLLHGAKASRLLKHIASGQPVSVCMTLLDGIVLARSLFEKLAELPLGGAVRTRPAGGR